MVLFAIAVGGLLIWQNLGVITLVFFGGIMTVKLPLAVWVLLFTLAGIISGLTLQFLYSFGRPLAAASPPGNDWERDSGDDWNFDAPPEKPTTIQDREEFPPRVADGEKTNFVKPPEDSYQTGSVYSYSYRTAKQTRGEKAEQVYDVNYRIITPPAQDENQEREVNKGDEEDWI